MAPERIELGIWIVLAYLAGSIPFGVIFARARGIDLQSVGSGNIGATNAARALGRRMGIVVFLCDAAKGTVPVLLARWRIGAGPALFGAPGEWAPALVGAAAFIGHLASPFLRFRGGKGVSTAFGVFVAIAPLPALIAGVLFAALYGLTRIASIGSLTATTVFVPAVFLTSGDPAHRALACFMWVLIVWRHHDNIARLLRGEESRGSRSDEKRA